MRIGLSSLGADCTSTFWDVVNPVCWFQDPLGIQPSLAPNPPTCTSGTQAQQQACQQAANQVAATANADPSYACATSNYQVLCALGLTDSQGNPNTGLIWLIGGIGAVALFAAVKR